MPSKAQKAGLSFRGLCSVRTRGVHVRRTRTPLITSSLRQRLRSLPLSRLAPRRSRMPACLLCQSVKKKGVGGDEFYTAIHYCLNTPPYNTHSVRVNCLKYLFFFFGVTNYAATATEVKPEVFFFHTVDVQPL